MRALYCVLTVLAADVSTTPYRLEMPRPGNADVFMGAATEFSDFLFFVLTEPQVCVTKYNTRI